MPPQRLQLGSEQKYVAGPAVIQGFLAHTIASQMEPPCLAVPDREREHAVELFAGSIQSPGADPRQHHFGVRRSDKAYRARQPLPQLPEIVNLPVHADDIASAS